MDPGDETPGVGWSIAANMQTARSQALSRCRQTAGLERADACIVEDLGICLSVSELFPFFFRKARHSSGTTYTSLSDLAGETA
jgi:hypothetical protein